MNAISFTIAAVERESGLSKDVLRVWERRYGFPVPERDANGERLYPAEQVERLCLIKRLIDQGHRPGKLIAASTEELVGLARRRPQDEAAPAAAAGNLADMLDLIQRHDVPAFQQAMQQRLARQGLQGFVQDTVAPLARCVGDAWEEGRIEVFEEHLFTELTKRLLRQAIAGLPGSRQRPRILLTTLPAEQHVLGLLMAEALLALEGAECIPLGAQMPLLEIGRAAAAHGADVVALSFSQAFPQRQIPGLLRQLRQALPDETEIWAGGTGIARLARMEGVQALAALDEALLAVAAWRAAHP